MSRGAQKEASMGRDDAVAKGTRHPAQPILPFPRSDRGPAAKPDHPSMDSPPTMSRRAVAPDRHADRGQSSPRRKYGSRVIRTYYVTGPRIARQVVPERTSGASGEATAPIARNGQRSVGCRVHQDHPAIDDLPPVDTFRVARAARRPVA